MDLEQLLHKLEEAIDDTDWELVQEVVDEIREDLRPPEVDIPDGPPEGAPKKSKVKKSIYEDKSIDIGFKGKTKFNEHLKK